IHLTSGRVAGDEDDRCHAQPVRRSRGCRRGVTGRLGRVYVDHLQLVDFRNYEHVELPLTPGVTIFVGRNGQGKTNLVEAVDYLATLGSHRVASDTPLVRAGAEQAIIRGRVRAGSEDERAVIIELEINPGRANRAQLNRSPVPR